MTEEEIERQLITSHIVGKAAAMESFAAKLRTWAGDAFATHQDEKARWYRELAERAGSDAKVYRAEQKLRELQEKKLREQQPP